MIADKEEEQELSQQFFTECSELQIIEEPFELNSITQERERRDLQTQFELLRALTQTKKHKTKLRVNSIIENKKNRYPEQSIYEHSRVILPQTESQDSTYINANYIPLDSSKRVIITQGPLESTQENFQQMLQQEKIQCVIMLCNPLENGKARCFDYYSNRQVETLKEVEDYLTVSRVNVKNEEKEQQNLSYIHLHYSEWPDRGLPQNTKHIRQVLLQTLKYDRIVIHCSAGLGRSGVLTSILFLQLKALQNQKISVFGTVRKLRQYRYGSIQNNEQYKFVYDYLCELQKQQE